MCVRAVESSRAPAQDYDEGKVAADFANFDADKNGKVSPSVFELRGLVFSAAESNRAPRRSVSSAANAKELAQVSMAEFLKAEGIDVSKFNSEELEQARLDEIDAENEALRRGVAAVEIVPGGMESREVGVEASCVAYEAVGVESVGQPVAVAAVAECVAVEGDYVIAGEAQAVAAEAVPM